MTERDRLLGQLMKEAQDGDATSYETLLSEVYMFLGSYLKSKVPDNARRDDVAQEVLLAVHNSRHTFDGSRSFMSWLLAITHYKVNDSLRLQFKLRAEELEESLADTGADALTALIENQNLHLLRQAIDELELRPRQVLQLLKIEGHKISEVAHRLRLSESNVKVIAHRACQGLELKLRGKL